jgi:hypothetical protein
VYETWPAGLKTQNCDTGLDRFGRLPNGPERQEVFRRFWANLCTQECQDPLPREGAKQLALRTAALRELEALEDEERRETGGRELARPLTLIREDGLLAGGRYRSSPASRCVFTASPEVGIGLPPVRGPVDVFLPTGMGHVQGENTVQLHSRLERKVTAPNRCEAGKGLR